MRARPLNHLCGDGFARRDVRLALGDLPAVGFYRALLCLGRISRHHNVGGNSAPAGCLGERRGVVAGRRRGDAKLCLFIRQGKDGVGGAADLE